VTEAYGAALHKVLADMRSGAITTPAAANTAFTSSKDAIRDLDETVTKWYEGHETGTSDGGAAIRQSLSSALLFTFIMTIAALTLSFTIAYLFARSIRRPLESAVAGARAVAQGRFEIDAPEELGQVQQAFDGVRDLLVETRSLKNKVENDNRELQLSITELLRVVATASEGDLTVRAPVSAGALGNVSDAFNSLLESLQELLGVVSGQIKLTETIVTSVREASTKMAVGATTQSAELLDTSKLIQRMSADIAKVSDGADVAVAAAKRTEVQAAEGSKAVDDVIAGMSTLRANVQAGAKKMKNLGDRSMEITGIVSTISRISEQTNMLALNAAIEAARAGEHGRGFSVVADEVRKLAERATNATKDIEKLVRAINADTSETIKAIEQQTQVVEDESRTVSVAGESLRKIRAASDQSAGLVASITDVTKVQVEQAQRVARTMESVTAIAHDTQQGAETTVQTINELVRVSSALKKSTGRFRVSNGSR
jgi:methyl-accepting chemotaxis protein